MDLVLSIASAVLYIIVGWMIHDIWIYVRVERRRPWDINKAKRLRWYTTQDGALLITIANWSAERADALAEEKGWVLLDSRGYEEEE